MVKGGKKVELIWCLMKQHCSQQAKLKGVKIAKGHKSAGEEKKGGY